VTLMTSKDQSGADLPAFDGSTWDPFAKRLLFTAESNAPGGGVWQTTLDPGTPAVDLRGVIGSSAYEASRTTPPATCGSSRTTAARPSGTPGSRTRSSTGSCRTTGPT
jgi:hypothetical protein